MAAYVRASAFNSGGTFDNLDLLWYAKGVRAMQERSLDDPASWWFFAAIHGEYVSPHNKLKKFPGWGFISGPPAVPTAPLPSISLIDRYWNQCQHQSWYFPPWHRGYLLALEAQIRADVINQGGPADWALPYWNYFGSDNQFDIPPAFTQAKLPDGTPNPLLVANRYGPYADGVIFVPTAAGVQAHPADTPPRLVTDICMSNTVYTGINANTLPPGFGGPVTGISHDGGTSGNLESNPHNSVHRYTGGSVSPTKFGLMSDAGTAALDPIFYLHHANIDRMWEIWNTNPANENPVDPNWLNGPASSGDNEFIMPMPGNTSWIFIPQQVNRVSQLNYTYDNLPQPAPAPNLLTARLMRLGAPAAAERVAAGPEEAKGGNVELVGANEGSLSMTGLRTDTTVRLDHAVRNKVSASLARAVETAAPDRVYLKLENVRGTLDASMLSVFVNVPENTAPDSHPELLAGSVSLFGLRGASMKDGKHAGTGLSFVFDISDIVDRLHLNQALSLDSLRVTILPDRAVPKNAAITIGRVSIYRHGI